MTHIHYPFPANLMHNFTEYVYYPQVFLPHEMPMIDALWQDNEVIKAELSHDTIYDDELRKSDVSFVENNDKNQWLYQRLSGLAMKTNLERYNFDLLGFHEILQLARYSEGDFFDWHLDFGPGESSIRKLSLTLQLSDPDDYEGGDLQFMVNQKIVTAPREKGTVIIFPSFIIHRVTPVTKGVRESLVAWVAGPPYR